MKVRQNAKFWWNSDCLLSSGRIYSKFIILLYLEFCVPTFTSAEILRAAELSLSSSVKRVRNPVWSYLHRSRSHGAETISDFDNCCPRYLACWTCRFLSSQTICLFPSWNILQSSHLRMKISVIYPKLLIEHLLVRAKSTSFRTSNSTARGR